MGVTSATRLPAIMQLLHLKHWPAMVLSPCCQHKGSREEFPLKTRLEPPFQPA